MIMLHGVSASLTLLGDISVNFSSGFWQSLAVKRFCPLSSLKMVISVDLEKQDM